MLTFSQKNALLYVPDSTSPEIALSRTDYLCIAAHPDDAEGMAPQAITQCFGNPEQWFSAIIVADGAGSARSGIYTHYSNEQMIDVRILEQKKAAMLGEYGYCCLLMHPSRAVKNPTNADVVEEIKLLIELSNPKIIYTHNLADKHDTHIGVAAKTIKAIRQIEPEKRPKKLYGPEVWRSLDWVCDEDKVVFDVSDHPNILAALMEVFDSQIAGGKRYDLATVGRRLANASFYASHEVDTMQSAAYAIDMTPLILDDDLDLFEYIDGYIHRFRNDVRNKLANVAGLKS